MFLKYNITGQNENTHKTSLIWTNLTKTMAQINSMFSANTRYIAQDVQKTKFTSILLLTILFARDKANKD